MKKKPPETGLTFKDYYKRAVNQMVVLKLLSERPMYCYEITVKLKEISKDRYTSNILYQVLYRLKDLGYVDEVDTRLSAKNMIQIIYGITDSGKERLKQLQSEYLEMHGIWLDIMAYSEGDSDGKTT